jgi:phosphoribosylglycinamide formyltransferase-1
MAELIVLASGSGTNFEAIAHRVTNTPHRLSALVTDKPAAGAIARAGRLGIPVENISYEHSRSAAEQQLAAICERRNPDLICLAGFMRILTPGFVERFPGRIINIHPSILPDFPGLRAIERSFADPKAELGISIHYVDAGVDTGPIIEQHRVERTANLDLASAEAAIHRLEHRYYPEVVVRLLDNLPG